MVNGVNLAREHAHSIANTVADYRAQDGEECTEAHVLRWAEQFTCETRARFLAELDHVLKKTYISKSDTAKFMAGLTKPNPIVGKDPATFWRRANILKIQHRGNSQNEMNVLLDSALKQELNIGVDECGAEDGPLIYVDEALFTGNHVVNDFRNWLPGYAPADLEVHVIVIASHSSADFYIRKAMKEIAAENGKRLSKLHIWRGETFKNLKNDGTEVDVLRLRNYPEDAESEQYRKEACEGKEPALMRIDADSESKFFSSEQGRHLLEQEFWKAGLEVRKLCYMLKVMHRPLGYTSSGSENKLGFGSLVVTYRNCPNNCPLALWADYPWYPLLRRRNNQI